jgi:hypothetical protein
VTVIQVALLVAIHAQTFCVVTPTVPVVAAAEGDALVAPSVNVHGVTVTDAVAVTDPTPLVAVNA